ncbi:MAG: hypothetical protein CM15mP55_3560 [Hyphomicrobiales bacterium]|nr:MAG: hypothetical protein CM15mP55_3560 [Hyphomicrobiales bacterium]
MLSWGACAFIRLCLAGFTRALAGRIQDCDSSCVITADEGSRRAKNSAQTNTDAAWNNAGVSSVVVVADQGDVNMVAGRDIWYHEVKDPGRAKCPPEE